MLARALALLVVALLALSGYVYSAGVLMQSLLASFDVVVAVALAEGLLSRWLLLGQQRLSLRRLEERRAAQAQLAQAGADAPPESESDISLERVDAQTRSLLRALRLTLLVVGLGWVWASVLPAVGRLDEIALWHFVETG